MRRSVNFNKHWLSDCWAMAPRNPNPNRPPPPPYPAHTQNEAALTPPASAAAPLPPHTMLHKSKRKKKSNLGPFSDHHNARTTSPSEVASPPGPHLPRPSPPQGGVLQKIDSNWKQLQATLKKGHTGARRSFRPLNNAETTKDETGSATNSKEMQPDGLSPRSDDSSLTHVLAMDCEMVGVGLDGRRSALARVSLVNIWGNVVYDEYVRPMQRVTDFRTNISGVRARDLRKAKEFSVVQKEVAQLIFGRLLVGHAVQNDLKVMYLSHPKKDIRDTAVYVPLRSKSGHPRALRHLAAEILGVKIQEGEHCSVQDACAAMYVYQHLKQDWENSLFRRLKS